MSDIGYEVVPGALRKSATELSQVADAWKAAKDKLEGQTMRDYELGQLGKDQDVPGSYNEALSAVLDRLGQGFEALSNATTTMREVATAYEAKEVEYYTTFGYLAEQVDR